MLSVAERQLVLDITMEEVRGRVPVVAGTSSVNPLVVIEQSVQVRRWRVLYCILVHVQGVRGEKRRGAEGGDRVYY